MQVRSVLGDFAVLVAIVLWTSVDFCLALDTPKLNVPIAIKPTISNRSRRTLAFSVMHCCNDVMHPQVRHGRVAIDLVAWALVVDI